MDDKTQKLLMDVGGASAALGNTAGNVLLAQTIKQVSMSRRLSQEAVMAGNIGDDDKTLLRSACVTAMVNCAAAIVSRAIIGELRTVVDAYEHEQAASLEALTQHCEGLTDEILDAMCAVVLASCFETINSERTERKMPPVFGEEAVAEAEKFKRDAERMMAELLMPKLH